jgi:iron complex outermembrane receptor protein
VRIISNRGTELT